MTNERQLYLNAMEYSVELLSDLPIQEPVYETESYATLGELNLMPMLIKDTTKRVISAFKDYVTEDGNTIDRVLETYGNFHDNVIIQYMLDNNHEFSAFEIDNELTKDFTDRFQKKI